MPSGVIIVCIILPVPAASAMAEPDMPAKMTLCSDVDLRQAAPEAADHGVAEVEQPLGHGADVHELGGEDEQRHREDDVVRVHAVEQLLGGGAHVEAGEQQIEDRAGDHGVADRQAQQARAP